MEKNYHPLNYKNQKLHFDNVLIENIVQKYPTPFYLYSEQSLKHQYRSFEAAAKAAGIKNFLICYALKSNSNLQLLKILSSLGAGADIVSSGELKRSLEASITPDKIVFSGVGKTAAEIEEALLCDPKGIQAFNVESLEELEEINQIASRLNKTARISFRLNPKVHAKTHRHISTGFKTHKFGLLQSDILKAIKQKKYWSHSKLVGLSVHIGSQLTELKATKMALKKLMETAESCPPLEIIDVGGGLGISYEHFKNKKISTMKNYMELVAEHVNQPFVSDKCKIVFEPGRIISARSGAFITKVLRTKMSENCRFVIVDGGMNDFVRPSLYNAYHEIYSSKEYKKSKAHDLTDVVGPICETADCFATKRLLPKLENGDFLAIADTGAYGMSMASNYNLRPRTQEILITEDGKQKLITQAENYQNLR
ncbi:MAG: diaminopimelate decarboxylase [Bacteriovoracaceae bacterium]|nr:diaminopimelate decarboxylase [Bacteriovoracaceae bacterium]